MTCRPRILAIHRGCRIWREFRVRRVPGPYEEIFMIHLQRLTGLSSFKRFLSLGLLGAAALGASAAAQARDDIYWSVGVGTPGVSVGVSNARPYYAPAPVYVQPAPVYVAPRPVYVAPRPIYQAPPVVYGPAPVYYGPPGHRKHHKHKWEHRRGHWHDG